MKQITTVAAVLSLGLVLTGCGGEGEEATPGDGAGQEQTTGGQDGAAGGEQG